MRAIERPALVAAPLLAVLAFWGGVGIAQRRFPAEFDWRYMTLSTLLSPRGNPAGHLWGAAAIGLSGVFGLLWALALVRVAGRRAVGDRLWGAVSLGLGSVGMACSGLLPLRMRGLPKGHEILTVLAFAGLSVGVVCLTIRTAQRVVRRRANRPTDGGRRWGAAAAGVLVIPIVLAGCAQAYVFFARPDLHWVGLSWRARGVPAYLSFAFWEWITCAVLSAYMGMLAAAGAVGYDTLTEG
jgi:hypothetical protein